MSFSELAFVFVAALVTALATGLGALPFAFVTAHGKRWLGRANALAAGIMLGAGVSLLAEGASRSITGTTVGLVSALVYGVWARQARSVAGAETGERRSTGRPLPHSREREGDGALTSPEALVDARRKQQ